MAFGNGGDLVNKERRATLKKANEHLSIASDLIEEARSDEQYSLENFPENLQSSDKYEAMENAVDNLDDALENIEEARNNITCAIG